MKNKTKLSILAGLILAIMLFLAVPLGAGAAKSDYSKPGATEKITLNSADILERIMRVDDPGFTLTPGERAYLAEFGSESVSYSAEIPYLDNVLTAYDEAADTLSVTAFEYSYVTSNGISMLWKPKSIHVGEKEAMLLQNGTEYCAELDGPFPDGVESVKVLYTTTLPSFNKRVINSLLNKAYTDVVVWDEYKAYLDRLDEYNEALHAYNQYLAAIDNYEKSYAEYSVYLGELKKYEDALAVYEKYEQELKDYNEKYALYRKYLDDKATYDKNLALYNNYVENSKTVKKQLAIIDGMLKNSVIADEKTGQLMYRQLYGAITGPTVAEVLENKSLIAGDHTGITGDQVDIASEATEKLRVLLDTYFSFATEEEKYTYYALNYNEFKTNLTILFRQLDLFYSNGKIRAGLKREDMKQKYEILLAQLFYTVNAISDEPVLNYDGVVYNASYEFDSKNSKTTPLSILGGDAYIVDENNATPIKGGYPAPVEEPTPIAEVTEPTKPASVKRPIAPDEVQNPGERPEAVTRPSPITNIDPPEGFLLEDPYVLPDSVVALVAEYRAGQIAERVEKTASVKIEVDVYSTKRFKNTDEVVIRFFDEAGNQLTTAFSVERGSFVEYGGEAPTKEEDDYATYEFIGWKNGPEPDAERVNMSAVDCDGGELNLYPLFSATKKLYKVTWNDGGSLTYTYEPLDAVPNIPFEPALFVDEMKSDGFENMRVFAGWVDQNGNHILNGVTKFEEENVYFTTYSYVPFMTVTNKDGEAEAVKIFLSNDIYSIDCSESVDSELNIIGLLGYIAGKGGLKIKAAEYEISFSGLEVSKMMAEGVSSLRLDTVDSETTESFAVRLLGENGGEINVAVVADIKLPCNFSDPDNMELYYLKDGVRTPINRIVASDESGQYLSARVHCGTEYTAITEYIVDLIPSDVLSLGIGSTVLCEGQQITVTYIVPNGVLVKSIYMLLDNGERVELDISDSGVITVSMPACRVSIGAEFEHIEYRVTFVSGETVVSEKTYKYGEMPALPTAPQKASDGVYTYEFIGWDKELCEVTSDTVYTAVYESTLIPPKEEETGIQLSDSVWKLVHRIVKKAVPAVIAVGILLPVSIISLIVVVVSVSKKRRKTR